MPSDEARAIATSTHASAKKALELISSLRVSSVEEMDFAASLLRDLVTTKSELERDRTKITKPLNAAKRAVDELFAPAKRALEQCEAELKAKLAAARQAVTKRRATELAEVMAEPAGSRVLSTAVALPTNTGISYTTKWVIDAVNESQLPKEYFSPDLTKISLRMATKNGRPRRASDEPEPIDGVTFKEVTTVSAKKR